MVTATITSDTPPAERARIEEQAAACLASGGLVILPTETVYGVFANAADPEAVGRLERLSVHAGDHPPRARHTWHAPSLAQVLDVVPIPHASHRFLMRRMLPGPVRFDVGLSPDELASVVERLGAGPGVLEQEGTVAVRVTNQPLTQAVLERAGTAVVANRLATAGWSPDATPEAAFKDGAAAEAGIDMAVDDGPARYGEPSSLIRLLPDGGYAIVAEGAYDARRIEKRARMRILFVCTGNTCRSPMAEAITGSIASGLTAESTGRAVQLSVLSAGTSAAPGMAASPQTGAALRELGIEPAPHRSRPLTRQLIAEADAIYTMSGWHRDEVIALDPAAASRTWLLDPDGQDVPDPVGLPQEVYNRTAAKLRELINQRMEELGVLGPSGEHSR